MELKKISTPLEISNAINRKIPESIIEERDGGRGTKLSYISGKTVTDMLNSVFGPMNWDFEINNSFIQESIPFFNTYAKSKEKVTHPESGKEGVWIDQAPVAWVQGTLTVRLVNEKGDIYTVKKQAFGSKSIIGKQSEQEHIFKSAQTDAMKKAATLLGIGLQIARTVDEENYRTVINREILWTEETMGTCEVLMTIMEFKKQYDISDYELDCHLAEFTEGWYINVFTATEEILEGFLEALQGMVG